MPSPRETSVAFLRDAIERMLLELGVVVPGYPAPVANAVEIGNDALIGIRHELDIFEGDE